MISPVTWCIDMPKFPLFASTPDVPGKEKDEISAPTNFQHVAHVGQHSVLPPPIDLKDLFMGETKPAILPRVAMRPSDGANLPGSGMVAPEQTLRTRVLGDREPLPFLGDLQARRAGAESVLVPPPPPPRIGSLAPAPARDLPTPTGRPIPPSQETKPGRGRPEANSLPVATEEARGAGRVRDMAGAIERGERPLLDTLGAARFL